MSGVETLSPSSSAELDSKLSAASSANSLGLLRRSDLPLWRNRILAFIVVVLPNVSPYHVRHGPFSLRTESRFQLGDGKMRFSGVHRFVQFGAGWSRSDCEHSEWLTVGVSDREVICHHLPVLRRSKPVQVHWARQLLSSY